MKFKLYLLASYAMTFLAGALCMLALVANAMHTLCTFSLGDF